MLDDIAMGTPMEENSAGINSNLSKQNLLPSPSTVNISSPHGGRLGETSNSVRSGFSPQAAAQDEGSRSAEQTIVGLTSIELDGTELAQDVVGARADSASPPLRMEKDKSLTKDMFAQHRHLIEWVLANNGYFHPDAQIAFSSRKGFHAVVATNTAMPSGAQIASCPMEVTMSVLNALDVKPFSSHGTCFPAAFLLAQAKRPESLQSFFLMEQLVLGDKSWWHPYVASLPTVEEVNDQQFDQAEDVIWLEGTNLKKAFETQSNKWRQLFDHGLEHLKRLEWPHALDKSYTWYVFKSSNPID